MEGGEKMSTTLRPEISPDNEYFIGKHRHYELKHFCMQYPEWKKACEMQDGMIRCPDVPLAQGKKRRPGNPTEICAVKRAYLSGKIELVERAARETDPVLGKYILKGITEGLSYEALRISSDIPCCRDTYYRLYRKFLWVLDSIRD